MHSFVKKTAIALQSMALAVLFAGAAHAADKVDINSADAKTIDRVLLNIGPSKAEAIVAHREANGPYKSLEQLAKVKGIGLKTVEKNRDRIQLGAGGGAKGKAASAAAAP
ncbi:ComEA-related DNA uptake protein [Lysobacter dokdonensis DS-58]|uniref:ComEA-related DNA uptake protein n=1 Tax=Lysobacter dokdonensis DS-58 TaxID=1300345 RepID=A0A0A2WHK8_9GAMM|nr:ComEA family DNA-binding protein [Lysobacter dokdonensis]KGQ17740.1 ComEA-related DNA uptake protein [Lysobacter dokdonensis DS-58]